MPLRYGFDNATGDIIFTMDAGGSFRVEEMQCFIMPLMEGWHIVKGSRFMHGGSCNMTAFCRIGNKFLTFVANILHKAGYTDLVCGYHAFQKSVLADIELESDGLEIDAEMYIKAKKKGLRVKEIPVVDNTPGLSGDMHSGLHDGRKILKTIIREYLT